MAKKTSKKSKKKTKSSIKPAADHSAQGPADDQDATVGIRAEGMPKFNPFSPTADEIQAAAAQVNDGEGSQSLAARGLELARKGSLEDPQVAEAAAREWGINMSRLTNTGSQTPTAHELSKDQGTELSGDQVTERSPEEQAAIEENLRAIIRKKHEEDGSAAGPPIQDKIQVPTKIDIRACPWGYGVFATEKIEDGEVIEEAPLIILALRTGDAKDQPKISALFPHTTPIGCNCEECKELGRRMVIASGYVQMYNHSDQENARMLQHKANKRIYVIEALKEINAGEQIFINYGSGYPRQWLGLPQEDA